jgi:hypothetical protein
MNHYVLQNKRGGSRGATADLAPADQRISTARTVRSPAGVSRRTQ